MGLIAAVIATVICAVLYVRMYQREVPEPIGKRQAAIPVGLGVIAVFCTLPLYILSGFMIKTLTGGSISNVVSSLALRSLIGSFILAGFTEEFIKLLMFLIVVKVVKPKNVYEYGFLCAGVGFGFTGLEDVIYGLQNPVSSIFRVFFFGMHMMFGLIMGLQLGFAKFSKQQGKSGLKHTILALFLPVLWHTLFDASTVTNVAFNADDENVQMIGVIVAIVMCVVSIVLQFVLLFRFKNKTAEYCAMRFDDMVSGGEAPEAEAPKGRHARKE
ncbi:MAG: PrsW family intramembrane metalloprotease [Atopobiaceae bacterium]|nr:PrsW family intramembrane metalloprotease [Atopobiaceae bacterium]